MPGYKKNPVVSLTISPESLIRLCDKFHLHRGAQRDNTGESSNNMLFMLLTGPSQGLQVPSPQDKGNTETQRQVQP